MLNIKGQINGDGFPDAETFIKDHSSQAIMLGTYCHNKLNSPITHLGGEGNKPMINVNVQMNLSNNGDFAQAWAIDTEGKKTPLPIVSSNEK